MMAYLNLNGMHGSNQVIYIYIYMMIDGWYIWR
jgi:hypothetical protein